MKAELIVRIYYDVEGEFSDSNITTTIRKRALHSGLGGSVVVLSDKIEMVLEGTPIAIGGFVAEIHQHIPRDSRITRLVPKSKTVIQSMNGKFNILEPELSAEPTPIVDSKETSDHEEVRRGLLAGEIHRVVVHSVEHHAAHAFNEEACAKLAEISDAEIALLFASMDCVFEHCSFNADAVKRLVSNPKDVVKLKLREKTPLAQTVGGIADCEVSAKLADPTIAATLLSATPSTTQPAIEALAIINVE